MENTVKQDLELFRMYNGAKKTKINRHHNCYLNNDKKSFFYNYEVMNTKYKEYKEKGYC